MILLFIQFPLQLSPFLCIFTLTKSVCFKNQNAMLFRMFIPILESLAILFSSVSITFNHISGSYLNDDRNNRSLIPAKKTALDIGILARLSRDSEIKRR